MHLRYYTSSGLITECSTCIPSSRYFGAHITQPYYIILRTYTSKRTSFKLKCRHLFLLTVDNNQPKDFLDFATIYYTIVLSLPLQSNVIPRYLNDFTISKINWPNVKLSYSIGIDYYSYAYLFIITWVFLALIFILCASQKLAKP